MTTDAEAIEASLSDPARFAVVFDRHFRAILRYLTRRIDRDVAEDLAAETFAQAFSSRHRYDLTRSDARPWLFGIATNLLRHHKRAERRQLLAYARTGVDPVTRGGLEEIDHRIDNEGLVSQVALALASLSHAEREVLYLYTWADLSYREIADALHLPLGTVRSRLSRARRRVRELLGVPGQYQDGVILSTHTQERQDHG